MSWSVGYDDKNQRDIGYGVPATCDHPDCDEMINRGLGYVCGGEAYGGDYGCGLFFCAEHRNYTEFEDDAVEVCERCAALIKDESADIDLFKPKTDVQQWIQHKLNDESWQKWREKNPDWVAKNRNIGAKND